MGIGSSDGDSGLVGSSEAMCLVPEWLVPNDIELVWASKDRQECGMMRWIEGAWRDVSGPVHWARVSA